ncbi:hypothetical protein R1flu_028707 [Riccia fluitans]|uniref:Uncharacterized protein n=1 Tax=Riccia fluitans TaxID=41844 RepID=A0ABD1XMG1_9MARC
MVKRVEEMQGTDARKPTTTVYDTSVGAQVKAEQGCIVRTPWSSKLVQHCFNEESYTAVVDFLASVLCISCRALPLSPCPTAALPARSPIRVLFL